MVRFVDEPYVTKKVRPKLSSVKWKMACGMGMTGLYFITLADSEKELFDIYPAPVFKQKRFRKSDRVIIGIAESTDSARGLIETMVNECLVSCGDPYGIRKYYENFIRDHL
ncbi:MAG: hypothetical protein IK121_09075 [Lachnospiraceae bacterium]|nr:hypothetical protein [Lachnospiraceae bacterium]